MAAGQRSASRVKTCLLVVAAAGDGKTTAVEPDPADGRTLYLSAAEALDRPSRDGALSLTLGPSGLTGAHIVVDDFDAIPASAQTTVLRRLARLPDAVQLSLVSRRPLS